MNSLDLHSKPKYIWNLDKAYFCSDPGRIKGVTGKGQMAHRIIQVGLYLLQLCLNYYNYSYNHFLRAGIIRYFCYF